MLMTPARRMIARETSRPTILASRPGWYSSICRQGLRRPVTRTMAVAPNRRTVPADRPSRFHPARGDVLPQRPRWHGEPVRLHLVEQFLVDQVHLAQIRLRRVAGDPRAVLHGDSGVGVPSDALPLHQADDVDLPL